MNMWYINEFTCEVQTEKSHTVSKYKDASRLHSHKKDRLGSFWSTSIILFSCIGYVIDIINTSTTINKAMITDNHPIFAFINKRSTIKNTIAGPRLRNINIIPKKQWNAKDEISRTYIFLEMRLLSQSLMKEVMIPYVITNIKFIK